MYSTSNNKILKDFFSKNKNQSFTAGKLVDIFGDQINKATIYRRLQALEENKEIRKSFNSKIEAYEYQYSSNCENHFHLVCDKCGKTIHLACEVADEFINHILTGHGFSIDKYNSVINGICKECSNNE